ncbi:MAG: hypothetical protein P8N02_03420 [Actinomycetota bacterium]|nr:hypothetical protein [Actinomycetota bacterium]
MLTIVLTLGSAMSAGAQEAPADGEPVALDPVESPVESDLEVDPSPELAPVEFAPPVIIMRSTQDAVTMSWTTAELTDAVLVWGETTDSGPRYDVVEFIGESRGLHDVVIDGLECGRQYSADLITSTPDGDAHRTRDIVMKTLPCSIDPASVADRSVIAFGDRAGVTWGTQDPTRGSVVFGLDANYGAAVDESQFGTFHEVALDGLDCGTEYHYRVIDELPDGTLAHSETTVFSTYSCDPLVDSVEVSASLDSAEVQIATDEPTSIGFVYGRTRSYGNETRSDTPDVEHALEIVDLECGETYLYQVIATPEGAEGTAWTPEASFSTEPCEPPEPVEPAEPIDPPENPDLPIGIPEEPEFVGVTLTDVHLVHAEQTSLQIGWTTDGPATGTLSYGLTPTYGAEMTSDVVANGHNVTIEGLECGTDYHAAVVATSVDHKLSWSGDHVFSTLACEAAVISDIAVVAQASEAVVSWTTDVLAHGQVTHGTSTSYGNTAFVGTDDLAQAVLLDGLTCQTNYHAQITSATPDGATSSSPDIAFTTGPCPTEPPLLF